MNRKPLIAIAILGIITAACSGNKTNTEYRAEYARLDSIPFNVETNAAARTEITNTFPEVYMFRSYYPEHDATVKYAIVTRPDTASILKLIQTQLDKMGDDVIYDGCKIEQINEPNGMRGWIFSSAPDKMPVQCVITDSATMVLHGRMQFNGSPADTAGVILPAVNAIAADMLHMAKSIDLNK